MGGLIVAPTRVIARLVLAFAFVAALAAPIVVFFVRGTDQPETWTITAAALAVMTSIISAWSSRRVVEFQEDAQRPNLFPTFDMTSRYGLALLRVKNTGGSTAHNIALEWNIALKNHHGETIGFTKKPEGPAIPVLLPGESISQIIGTPLNLLDAHPNTEYTGIITYEDTSSHTYIRPFRLDARAYHGTPAHDEESPKTHFELQKIPHELEAIRKAIEKLLSAAKG